MKSVLKVIQQNFPSKHFGILANSKINTGKNFRFSKIFQVESNLFSCLSSSKFLSTQNFQFSTLENEKLSQKNYFSKKSDRKETKILMIYVGGTIGMVQNERGVLAPKKSYLTEKIKSNPSLYDHTDDEGFFVTPEYGNGVDKIGRFKILEFEKLLDSSNMSSKEWNLIAKTIEDNYEDYDSFIVLHGTDTMTYTTSALSYMLEGLEKMVVVTGSQIPLHMHRSDALDNVIGALCFAIQYPKEIPEVCLYFNSCLFRGNRVSKVSGEDLRAFDGPHLPPIGTLNTNISVSKELLLPKIKNNINKFKAFPLEDTGAEMVIFYPGMSADILRAALLSPGVKGAVLLTYGSGNMPSDRKDYLDIINEAQKRGVVLVNVSQLRKGIVRPNAVYEVGAVLEDGGVIAGGDITIEAAYTKLLYLLAKMKKDKIEGKKAKTLIEKNFLVSIRGEISEKPEKI